MIPKDEQLEALLDRIPVLQGLQRTVAELPGGLTNQNRHVTTPDHDYVVRVFRGDAEQLGIDRDAEHANSRAAAEAGRIARAERSDALRQRRRDEHAAAAIAPAMVISRPSSTHATPSAMTIRV